MPASNKKITRRHYIVFCIWLLATLITASYFIAARLVAFDPDNKLTSKQSSYVLKQLQEIEGLEKLNLSNTIVHFTSNDCSCTQYSEDHKIAIDKQAISSGFNVININLPSDFKSIIPSTPSILIISETKELLYYGPYSAGLACSQSNGYVETVLNNYEKGYTSNLIINDLEGCYCNL